jgi:hypothetical protein
MWSALIGKMEIPLLCTTTVERTRNWQHGSLAHFRRGTHNARQYVSVKRGGSCTERQALRMLAGSDRNEGDGTGGGEPRAQVVARATDLSKVVRSAGHSASRVPAGATSRRARQPGGRTLDGRPICSDGPSSINWSTISRPASSSPSHRVLPAHQASCPVAALGLRPHTQGCPRQAR